MPVPGFAEQLFHAAVDTGVMNGLGGCDRQLATAWASVSRRSIAASTSISFNIAEGAGEYAPADKARFYRMARRSATESAAILDACRLLSLIDADRSQPGRGLLLRVVAMLTAMVVKLSGAGSDAGAGSGSDLATNLR